MKCLKKQIHRDRKWNGHFLGRVDSNGYWTANRLEGTFEEMKIF